MLIIPAIDLKDSKVVRLYKGDFDRVSEYSDDPVSVALDWQKLGAKLIHIVDLEGAISGTLKNKAIIKDILKVVKIQTEVSGGFRNLADIEEFIGAGATRIILGSKVQEDFPFLEEICKIYKDKLAVSLDAKNLIKDANGQIVLNLSIKGWQVDKEVSLNTLLEKIYSLGIKFINYTDISRDGTLSGMDFTSLDKIRETLKSFKDLKLIVSGGVSSIEDIKKLNNFDDIYGVIVGKALYEGKIDLKEAIAITHT